MELKGVGVHLKQFIEVIKYFSLRFQLNFELYISLGRFQSFSGKRFDSINWTRNLKISFMTCGSTQLPEVTLQFTPCPCN